MTDLYNDLNNYDLITEMEQLGEFQAQVEALLIDPNDYNHCLFENEVDELEESIEKAVDKFKSAIMKRRIEVLKILRDRKVFEDDNNYIVVFDDDGRYIYSAKAEYPE